MRRQRALLAATTLTVVAACTPASQPEPAPATTTSAGPVVASFVGEIPGSKAVVAVVANRDGVAVAFVCDGRRLAERFRGRLAANHADLASDRGARLQVMVTPAAARGMFTSPGQRPLGFAAALAVGAAGQPGRLQPADLVARSRCGWARHGALGRGVAQPLGGLLAARRLLRRAVAGWNPGLRVGWWAWPVRVAGRSVTAGLRVVVASVTTSGACR